MPVGLIRAWTRGMLPEFIRLGLGSEAVIRRVYSEFGAGYRRSVMQHDYRLFAGLAKKERAIRGIDPGDAPPPWTMVESDLRRAANYRDYGVVTLRDIQTGEQYDRFVSFYHDVNYTQDEMQFIIQGEYEEDKYRGIEEFVKFERRSLVHNRGFGY